MKINVTFLVAVAIFTFGQANAQSNSKASDNVSATNAIDAFINYTVLPGYLLYGVSESYSEIVGSAYLDDNWRNATLKLTGQDKEFNIQECKVNLYINQIEINYKNSIKAIDGSKVEKFTLDNYDASTLNHT